MIPAGVAGRCDKESAPLRIDFHTCWVHNLAVCRAGQTIWPGAGRARMLGDVKKSFRIARHAALDLSLAAWDRRIVSRYHRLQASVFRPGYSFHCNLQKKFVYIEIPKAASRTLLALVGKTQSIRDLGLDRFFELVDDEETMVFTFVRNPFDRLASCYRDKFARRPICALGNYRKDLRRHFGLLLRGLRQDEPLPFEQFVELACATCECGTDGHWLQMNRLVPTLDVAPNFIGHVETLYTDLQTFRGHVDIDTAIPRLNATRQTNPWTSALRQAVGHAYRPDFLRFGYPLD